jgi:hypothetical protein
MLGLQLSISTLLSVVISQIHRLTTIKHYTKIKQNAFLPPPLAYSSINPGTSGRWSATGTINKNQGGSCGESFQFAKTQKIGFVA